MNPRAGIVVVNYNGGAWLAQCLAALQAQTEADFRVMVVDNASTDGSQAAVSQLDDERFELLQLRTNAGFAAANNAGVERLIDCEWIALVNPDAFVEPGWLRAMLDAAQRHPQAASFGCCLVDARDAGVVDGTGDGYALSGRAFRRDHGRRLEDAHATDGDILAPCAAAALYRRDAWLDAGGMDADFFCYLEDVDLGLRLRLLGHGSRHVANAVCRHVGSGITGYRSDFARYHGQRNLLWVFVKNVPGALFWVLLPLHVLANLAAIAVAAVDGQTGVVLRAKADALRGLSAAWRKRATVQRTRRISVGEFWRLLAKRL